ncbi:MAG: periplasmic heavy metal sensor [Microvirga sp.]|nr:periplasmic heavy metal sensor [Microvirga sp.]
MSIHPENGSPENASPENPSPEQASPSAANPRKSRAWRYAAIGGVAIAAVAGANVALSSGSPGWGGHARGQSMMSGMGLDFAEWRVQRALTEAGTARETAEEVAAVMRGAADDILPIVLEMRDTREQAIAILTAPTIDREAAETLRRTRFESVEEASRLALAGLLDAAEKLTVEERKALIDNLAEARHRRRW